MRALARQVDLSAGFRAAARQGHVQLAGSEDQAPAVQDQGHQHHTTKATLK